MVDGDVGGSEVVAGCEVLGWVFADGGALGSTGAGGVDVTVDGAGSEGTVVAEVDGWCECGDG